MEIEAVHASYSQVQKLSAALISSGGKPTPEGDMKKLLQLIKDTKILADQNEVVLKGLNNLHDTYKAQIAQL